MKSYFNLLIIAVAAFTFAACGDDEEDIQGGGQSAKVETNGHEYVDLGVVLEDGTKVLWATTNVGSATETGYGLLYAWGEKESKSEYMWNTYAHGTEANLKKYSDVDGRKVLDLDDDAAHVNWGGDWVMPTLEEFQAMYDQTTHEYVTNYNGTTVIGFLMTSKQDTSKSIFLPASGYISDTAVTPYSRNRSGSYWTASLRTDQMEWAHYFAFDNYGNKFLTAVRYMGMSVRPVIRIAPSK